MSEQANAVDLKSVNSRKFVYFRKHMINQESLTREKERNGVLGPVDYYRSLGPKANNFSKQKNEKQNKKKTG